MALQGKGFKKQIGIGEQIAFATKVAPTAYLEFTDEAMIKEVEEIISLGIRGSAGIKRRVLGAVRVGGTIDMEVFPEGGIGMILKHALGTVNSTQPDAVDNADVYSHAFTLADALPEHGLTVSIDRDIGVRDYFGCKISVIELTASINAILMAKMTLVGREESSGAGMTPTYPTENPLIFTQGVFKIDTVEVEVSNFVLTLTNNLREDRYGIVGSGARQQVERLGKREVSGSFNRVFENNDLYDKFLAGTPGALELTFTGGVITGGDGSLNYTVKIEVPIAYYNSFTPGTGGAEMSDHTIPFRAIEGAVDKEMTITLQNKDVSY